MFLLTCLNAIIPTHHLEFSVSVRLTGYILQHMVLLIELQKKKHLYHLTESLIYVIFLRCHCKDVLGNNSLMYKCMYMSLIDASLSLYVSLSYSFSHRFKIPESAKVDTVLGNLTVFEYLENKVGIKLRNYLFIHDSSVAYLYIKLQVLSMCSMFKLIIMCVCMQSVKGLLLICPQCTVFTYLLFSL